MARWMIALMLIASGCSRTDSTPSTADESPGKPQEAVPGDRDYRLSGPYVHGNLSVYLLHQKNASPDDYGCILLDEALKGDSFRITEKAAGAEVNELELENTGDKPVYLQAGDTVKGGQQDRTIAVDTIVPPHSGKRPIDAFCVEPGRWSARASEVPSAGTSAKFSAAGAPVASNPQKLAILLEKDQQKVWDAGRNVNAHLASVSPRQTGPATPLVAPAGSGGPLGGATFALEEAHVASDSYVLATENAAVQKKLEETLGALTAVAKDQPDAVGAAFAVNGKVESIELYPTAGLFRKLWAKLLRSAALEAIEKPSPVSAPKPPAESDLRALMARMNARDAKVETRPDGQVVRIVDSTDAVFFETESAGKILRRQLLTK